jgi:hypothetical protein
MDIPKTQALSGILKDKSLLKDKCYIDGKWLSASKSIDVTNPVNESVIGSVPAMGRAETRQAIEKDRQGTFCNIAQMVRADDGKPGRPGPDHDGGAGQAAGGIAR